LKPTVSLSGKLLYGSGYPVVSGLQLASSGGFQPTPVVRLGNYVRADFRADKCWAFRRWKTTLYGEILNLTNHDNRIINFVEFLPNRQAVVHAQRALPITPTAGMVFEFWGERGVTGIVGLPCAKVNRPPPARRWIRPTFSSPAGSARSRRYSALPTVPDSGKEAGVVNLPPDRLCPALLPCQDFEGTLLVLRWSTRAWLVAALVTKGTGSPWIVWEMPIWRVSRNRQTSRSATRFRVPVWEAVEVHSIKTPSSSKLRHSIVGEYPTSFPPGPGGTGTI